MTIRVLPFQSRVLRFAAVMLITATLTALPVGLPGAAPHVSRPVAIAQSLPSSTDNWQVIYDQMPELPLENTYVNRETGQVNPNNTLVNRLVRYHLYVKGRPANYRLDWKLTMADYLGANDWMRAELYPGWDTLQTNPMETDIAAIRNLNRAQRDQLVNLLVGIFSASGNAPSPSSVPSSQTPTMNTPAPSNGAPPVVEGPGAADLLLP